MSKSIKAPWEVELRGDEVCSEEGCNRPAVYGHKRMSGDVGYQCGPHAEIGLEQGALDWIDGEVVQAKDWLDQVKRTPESMWRMGGGIENLLILKHTVGHEQDGWTYKDSHETTLQILVAALEVAYKLTEEKVERLKSELAE